MAWTSRTLPSKELRQDGGRCLEGPVRTVARCFQGHSHRSRRGSLNWMLLTSGFLVIQGSLLGSFENSTEWGGHHRVAGQQDGQIGRRQRGG